MSAVSGDVEYYVGLDWAAERHAVCVLDTANKIVASFPVPHSADGVAALLARLSRLGDPALIPVGIERPNGRLVVAALTTLVAALKDLDRSATAHRGKHPDSPIFTSLPRSGQINAAQVLAEWGDVREAYDRPDAVAALADATPVTNQSGKHRAAHFRWACNKRFRRAIILYADDSRHASPWAAKTYNDARAAGKDHPHAVRILARARIRVIGRCWQDGVPYDPTKHGNATKISQPPIAA